MNERKTPQAQENMDQANKDVNNAAQTLKDAFGGFISSVGDNLEAQRELNAAKRQDAAADAKEALDNAGKFVADKATEAWNGITDTADKIADGVKKGATTAVGITVGAGAMAVNAAKEAGEKAADAAHGAWNNAWAGIEDVAQRAQGKTLDTPETINGKQKVTKEATESAIQASTAGIINKGKTLFPVVKDSGIEHDTPTATDKSAESTAKEPAKAETQTEPTMVQFDQDTPELTPAAKKQDRVEKAADEKAEAERLETLYQDALAGKYGNGDERKKALGDDYDAIQARINEHYNQIANAEFADIETPSAEASVEMQA
mgnify:CR=1 FL=1